MTKLIPVTCKNCARRVEQSGFSQGWSRLRRYWTSQDVTWLDRGVRTRDNHRGPSDGLRDCLFHDSSEPPPHSLCGVTPPSHCETRCLCIPWCLAFSLCSFGARPCCVVGCTFTLCQCLYVRPGGGACAMHEVRGCALVHGYACTPDRWDVRSVVERKDTFLGCRSVRCMSIRYCWNHKAVVPRVRDQSAFRR